MNSTKTKTKWSKEVIYIDIHTGEKLHKALVETDYIITNTEKNVHKLNRKIKIEEIKFCKRNNQLRLFEDRSEY